MLIEIAQIEYGETPDGGRAAVVSFKVGAPPIQGFTIDVRIDEVDDPSECVRAAKIKVHSLALRLAEALAP